MSMNGSLFSICISLPLLLVLAGIWSLVGVDCETRSITVLLFLNGGRPLRKQRRKLLQRNDPKTVTTKVPSLVHHSEVVTAAPLLVPATQEKHASLWKTASAYTRCRANLTNATFSQLHEWTEKSVPLLQSTVKMEDGIFNAILLVKHLKDGKSWKSKRWLCHRHDQPHPTEAIILNPERKSSCEILILQCNNTDFTSLTVIVDEPLDGPQVHQEYDVRPFVQCEELYVVQSPAVQTAACTQVRGEGPLGILEEWVEYHRLVGFQHFWIYVDDDPSVIPTLPQRHYITYIPYNYCLCHHNDKWKFSDSWWRNVPVFQYSVMGECVLRARNERIRWLALHDVDEYFQVVDKNASTTNVIDYLETLPFKDDSSGVVVNAIPFGRNTDVNDTIELRMDYAWRKNYTLQKPKIDRVKVIIHPDKVNQVGVHFIHSGQDSGTYVPDSKLRVVHYKNSQYGVFRTGRSNDNLVRDDSLANSTLREQVNQRMQNVPTQG